MKAAQTGSYGMTVSYAVKAASLASLSEFRLYSYKADTNSFTQVQNANITIDANGYAHFNTNLGDYLVICDGALLKK